VERERANRLRYRPKGNILSEQLPSSLIMTSRMQTTRGSTKNSYKTFSLHSILSLVKATFAALAGWVGLVWLVWLVGPKLCLSVIYMRME
jgi:hypothetical protein